MRDYLTVLNRGTELLKYYRVNGFKSLPMTFVTGGTGSRPLAIELAKNTRNVSYVIHTADSGKSTRQIRLFFGNIPAIGDLRSRLIDLADPGSPGHAQITALLYHRLTNDSISDARAELRSIVEGTDDAGFIRDIMASDAPRPFSNIFLTHIRGFCRRVEAMQAPHRMFDYRCASIGNLFLTGAYYAYEQDLETAIALYKLLAGVKEDVIPATLENVHLAALMADGNTIAGQHNITSYKSGPVRELWHASSEDPNAERISPELNPSARKKILEAKLLVFSMGSFWTSVLSPVHLAGMAEAVRESGAVKILVTNSINDFETRGMTAADMGSTFLDTIRRRDSSPGQDHDYLHHIIANRPGSEYISPDGFGYLQAGDLGVLGIDHIAAPLALAGTPYYDNDLLLKLICGLM